jgi:hypothetical protein
MITPEPNNNETNEGPDPNDTSLTDASDGNAVEDPWTYDEGKSRQVGADYKLERLRGRLARRRTARALKSLDRHLVRLAKQVDTTIAWKRHATSSLAHQDALADQPTSLVLHVGRKIGITIAELGFTYAALELAGIPGRNLRMLLSVALAGLLVLLGQTVARTMKRAHLASEQRKSRDADDEPPETPVEPPSWWDWGIAAICVLFLGAFAYALTVLRADYNHAIAKASSAASSNTQLTVAVVHHTAPGWVLAILALVAPLIAIVAEYAQYHPQAHRLRRSLRLYAWNARKLRYILRRCGRPVRRGRRALLAFDNTRSRAFRMKQVIHAKHGGPEPVDDQRRFDADEPVRQLRARIAWYDAVATLAREALLEPQTATNREGDPKVVPFDPRRKPPGGGNSATEEAA